jgi:hypothetical protein
MRACAGEAEVRASAAAPARSDFFIRTPPERVEGEQESYRPDSEAT